MAAPRHGEIRVEGLAETIKALRKFDREVGKEAVDIFRDEAKLVQKTAKSIATKAPAATHNTGWIGRSATGKSAGVSMLPHKNARAYATEWGMEQWQYRDWSGKQRGTVQKAMKRRTFKSWRGNKFTVRPGPGPGHVIQQSIRNHLPGMEKRVAKRLHALLNKQLDRAGVKR